MEIFNLIIQMIAAVGSVLAAFASCQALKIANQANQLAERTATVNLLTISENLINWHVRPQNRQKHMLEL